MTGINASRKGHKKMWMSLHNVKKIIVEHKESATPGVMVVELSFKRDDGSNGRITCFLEKEAEVSFEKK
jgi:hypothetical protein